MKKYIFVLLLITIHYATHSMEERIHQPKRSSTEAFGKEKNKSNKKRNCIENNDFNDQYENIDHLLNKAYDEYQEQLALSKESININAQDMNGDTALIRAARNRDKSLTKWLIQNGADVNIQNNDRRTALMEAANFLENEIGAILVENGASRIMKDIYGQTASDIYDKMLENDPKSRLKHLLICDNNSIATALFNPGDDINSTLIDLIKCEKKSIKIAIYTFTLKDIAYELIKAKYKGIDIELVADSQQAKKNKNMMNVLNDLVNHGIQIWFYPCETLMHNKFCIFEDNICGKSLVFNGSYNFTHNASDYSQENVTIFDNSSMVDQFKKDLIYLKLHPKMIAKKFIRSFYLVRYLFEIMYIFSQLNYSYHKLC